MRKLVLDDAVCELLNVTEGAAELFDMDGRALGLYLPHAMDQERTREPSLVGMKEEYPALRQEILYWQNFRFVLLGASIALVSGVMAFGSRNAGAPGDLWGINLWTLISAFLLGTLTLAAALSLHAVRGNALTAAYLTTFYGETTQAPQFPDQKTSPDPVARDWDSRLVQFKSSLSPFGNWIEKSRLNHWLALIYFLLGLVSVTLPVVARNQAIIQRGERAIEEWVIVGAMALLLIITLFGLWVPAPRDRYLEIWRGIKQNK